MYFIRLNKSPLSFILRLMFELCNNFLWIFSFLIHITSNFVLNVASKNNVQLQNIHHVTFKAMLRL